MDRCQEGFTLVELTVVVVIVGILGAMAVPRFANMRADARTATVRAFGGALASAAAMAHAKWLVAGGAGTASVIVEGKTVDMDPVSGYPSMSATGIGAAMGCESGSQCQGMKIDYAPFLSLFTPAGAFVGRCTAFYNKANGGSLVDVTRCDA